MLDVVPGDHLRLERQHGARVGRGVRGDGQHAHPPLRGCTPPQVMSHIWGGVPAHQTQPLAAIYGLASKDLLQSLVNLDEDWFVFVFTWL